MEFYAPEVVEMLGDAGARVVNDKLVRIPSRLVEDACKPSTGGWCWPTAGAKG